MPCFEVKVTFRIDTDNANADEDTISDAFRDHLEDIVDSFEVEDDDGEWYTANSDVWGGMEVRTLNE